MIRGTVVAAMALMFLNGGISYGKSHAERASMTSKMKHNFVGSKLFCQKVGNVFTTVASQQGLDQRESQRFSGKAATMIYSQLSSGKLNQYLDVTSLESSSSVSPTSQHQWISVPEILVSSMGITPKNVLFIDQVNDLRFSPQMAPGSQLLVLATEKGDLTPERAMLVAQSAQSLGVSVSIIWTGKGRISKELELVSSLTAGAILDFSAQNACRSI